MYILKWHLGMGIYFMRKLDKYKYLVNLQGNLSVSGKFVNNY